MYDVEDKLRFCKTLPAMARLMTPWSFSVCLCIAADPGPELPIWQEFLALMKGIWVVFWNTAIFMGFAHVLHT